MGSVCQTASFIDCERMYYVLTQVPGKSKSQSTLLGRLATLAMFAVFLAGCDHSLQIQGQGDIVSATGSRSCSLEQQPCSFTIVGDYVETYTARPRSGWRFASWEGCGSNNNQCVLNVPAETVQQFWGKPVAPLVAIFEREGQVTVSAGPDQTVVERNEVILQSTVSGGQGSSLSYRWRQTAGDRVDLGDDRKASLRFEAPSVRNTEELRFELVVTGGGAPAIDSVAVEVRPNGRGAGDLVYSREIAPVANGRVWEVAYRSTTLRGDSVIVTGWVARPNIEAPSGGYPVLAFAHGTTGLVGRCAPTQSSTPSQTIPLLSEFLARGFVVAATDYQGLSPISEGYHHYLVGPDEARSVLDSVRAARQFTDASANTVLFGHSQGGHAVIFANELASKLAPELNILGTIGSGSGVAADFDQMLEYIKQSPYKGYLVMVGLAQNAAYGDGQVPLSTWFTPEGIEVARVMDSICIDELVATFAPLDADDLFVPGTPQPLAGRYDPIRDALPGLRAGSSPLLLIHGRNDPQIRPDFLVPWIEQTCARGQQIEVEWFNTGHRVPYEAPGAVKPVIADWIEDRFAGRPVSSDCGAVPRP